MAALRDDRSREMLNFKSFAARKKAEYALRFPFLTDRQILAKLRRVWKAASAARSHWRDLAIQPPHAGLPLPTPTNHQQARMCPKGDLSAFDVDRDPSLSVLCPLATASGLSSTSLSAGTNSENLPAVTPSDTEEGVTARAAEDKLPTSAAANGDSSPAAGCAAVRRTDPELVRGAGTEGDTSAYQNPTKSLTVGKSQSRRPLQVIDNSPTKSLANPKFPAETDLCGKVCVPSPCPPPHTVCVEPRNEAMCCPTNTLPFSSSEARCGAGFVSERCVVTQTPIMAGVVVGAHPKHPPPGNGGLNHSTSSCMEPLPGTKKARDVSYSHRSTFDIDAVRSGAVRASQSSLLPGGAPQFASLCTGSLIHSLPSPAPAPPSPAAFLESSAAPVLRPSASSSDEISDRHIFELGATDAVVAKCPSDRSSVDNTRVSPDIPLDTLTPVTATDLTPGTTTDLSPGSTVDASGSSEILSTGVPVAEVGVATTDGVRRRLRRCRSKRRRETFLPFFPTVSHAAPEEGAGNGTQLLALPGTTGGGVQGHVKPLTHQAEERRKFRSEERLSVSGNDAVQSSNTVSNVVSTAGAPSQCHSPHSEQTVPGGDQPQSSSASPPRQTVSSSPAEVKEDLMCDMFQLLTPDRPSSEPTSRRHSRDVSSVRPTSKRRVFRSVPTESSSNFYSMFMDESDIFM